MIKRKYSFHSVSYWKVSEFGGAKSISNFRKVKITYDCRGRSHPKGKVGIKALKVLQFSTITAPQIV